MNHALLSRCFDRLISFSDVGNNFRSSQMTTEKVFPDAAFND
jgi:hypothetical protein